VRSALSPPYSKQFKRDRTTTAGYPTDCALWILKCHTEIFHSERIAKRGGWLGVRLMEQREIIDMPRLSPVFFPDGTVYFIDIDGNKAEI